MLNENEPLSLTKNETVEKTIANVSRLIIRYNANEKRTVYLKLWLEYGNNGKNSCWAYRIVIRDGIALKKKIESLVSKKYQSNE